MKGGNFEIFVCNYVSVRKKKGREGGNEERKEKNEEKERTPLRPTHGEVIRYFCSAW